MGAPKALAQAMSDLFVAFDTTFPAFEKVEMVALSVNRTRTPHAPAHWKGSDGDIPANRACTPHDPASSKRSDGGTLAQSCTQALCPILGQIMDDGLHALLF